MSLSDTLPIMRECDGGDTASVARQTQRIGAQSVDRPVETTNRWCSRRRKCYAIKDTLGEKGRADR